MSTLKASSAIKKQTFISLYSKFYHIGSYMCRIPYTNKHLELYKYTKIHTGQLMNNK